MNNQTNKVTSSLEQVAQTKKEHKEANETQELATQQDIQEILKQLNKLQMHVDRILDVM